jgi:hypothetical protein
MTNQNYKNLIKYAIAFIVVILLWVLVVVYASNKQEPIQKILNQISENENQLQLLEEKQAELNKANDEAKAKLLNEYGLQLTNSEIPNNEEWTPWQLNESGDAQQMPVIESTTEHERFKELANAYGLNPSTIWEVENHYWIKEGVILCITVAETSGWNRGYGWKNIGSVGSNDRWDRPTYALMEAWLEAIGKTLNNQYLGSKKTLGCLSNAGSCKENNDNGKRYATSESSREKNMVACLSTIYWSINASDFGIRR